MRKVLESDLSKTDSFANKLVDKRYREFAAAFQFGSANKAAIQTAAQSEALTEAYSEHRIIVAGRSGDRDRRFKGRMTELLASIANPQTSDVAEAVVNDPTLFAFLEKLPNLNLRWLTRRPSRKP